MTRVFIPMILGSMLLVPCGLPSRRTESSPQRGEGKHAFLSIRSLDAASVFFDASRLSI